MSCISRRLLRVLYLQHKTTIGCGARSTDFFWQLSGDKKLMVRACHAPRQPLQNHSTSGRPYLGQNCSRRPLAERCERGSNDLTARGTEVKLTNLILLKNVNTEWSLCANDDNNLFRTPANATGPFATGLLDCWSTGCSPLDRSPLDYWTIGPRAVHHWTCLLYTSPSPRDTW